ncbi:MAG: hypothetical protein F4Z34_10655 [Acidimicrobiaceae bacterium]|nr:hypothetical protein [Acidimicrobiaceae bacterium]
MTGTEAPTAEHPPCLAQCNPSWKWARRASCWLAGAIAVIGTACGTAGHEPAMTGSATVERFDAALGCEALADRWAMLQQEYLHRLGTATEADLDEPSPAVASAGQWLGNAMIEQTRDAVAVGCDELVSGSAALCARVDGLSAPGEAAEITLDRLRDSCS